MKHKLVLEFEIEAESIGAQLDIVYDIEKKVQAVERPGSKLTGWGLFPLSEEEEKDEKD